MTSPYSTDTGNGRDYAQSQLSAEAKTFNWLLDSFTSGTAGVIVDEVEEVLTVDADQLDEVPGAGSDAIDAIAKIDDRLVVLLTPDRLLAGVGDVTYA